MGNFTETNNLYQLVEKEDDKVSELTETNDENIEVNPSNEKGEEAIIKSL